MGGVVAGGGKGMRGERLLALTWLGLGVSYIYSVFHRSRADRNPDHDAAHHPRHPRICREWCGVCTGEASMRSRQPLS